GGGLLRRGAGGGGWRRVRGNGCRRELRERLEQLRRDRRGGGLDVVGDRPLDAAAKGPLPEVNDPLAEVDELLGEPALQRFVVAWHNLGGTDRRRGGRAGLGGHGVYRQILDARRAGERVAKRLRLGDQARNGLLR